MDCELDLKLQLDQLKRENAELAAFVSLTQNILASYNVTEDDFCIFIVSDNGDRMELYHGPYYTWKDTMISSENVDADYIEDFNDLCDDMTTARSFFLRTVKFRLFADERLRKCLISGKSIKIDGQDFVYSSLVYVNDAQTLKEDEDVNDTKLDEETGLMNREAILDYCKDYIASGPQENVTLGIIELDNFDELKETYGEDFCKDVVVRTADIVKEVVGTRGRCGRLNETQMLIAVDGLTDNESIRSVLRPIRNQVNWMYGTGEQLKVSCSIGSSTYPLDAPVFETVFMYAEKMLQLAIEKGKNKYLIYLDEIHRDYIQGGKPVDPKDSRFFKYRKIRSMNQFIRDYNKSDETVRNSLIEMMCKALDVDCALIYDRNKKSKTILFGEDRTEESINFLEVDNYIESFREDGLLTIDNLINFEQKAPAMFDVYSKAGIKQAVQYVVGGNIFSDNDVVITFNRYSLLKKWTEQDINYIAILGEILGNTYKQN